MSDKMSLNDLGNSVKFFVELGGVYKVTEDWYVVNTKDEEPVGVKVGKNKALPIRILHDSMTMGDYRILNPYVESSTVSKEREWFHTYLTFMPGAILKATFAKIVEQVLDKDGEGLDYEAMPIVTKFVKKINKKTA